MRSAVFFHYVTGYSGFWEVVLITATLIAAVPIGAKAFQAGWLETFSIALLVTLTVIGALIIGEYVASAIVTFLFLFGDYLEERTLAKTRFALKGLTDLAPQEAGTGNGAGCEVLIKGGEVMDPIPGMIPKTISRKLSLFEDEGWMEQHGQREIHILNLDALLLLE